MRLMNLDPSAFVADPELLKALKNRSHPVDCSEERVLFCQGDPPAGVYIVHAGEVVACSCPVHEDRTLDLRLGPGALLGLPGTISNRPYSLSATALAGAKVSLVACEEFANLMLTEPAVAVLILKVLAAEVRTARIAACKG